MRPTRSRSGTVTDRASDCDPLRNALQTPSFGAVNEDALDMDPDPVRMLDRLDDAKALMEKFFDRRAG